jgi:hypothetical protein
LFGGFGITGSGSKQLLIRGIGPRLAMSPFNVADALLNTQLTLYAGSPPTQIAFNSPWGGTAALIAADNLVGAYAVPTNSLDSMLYPSPLPAATYSAAVAGVGTAIGDAVVELYDADPAPPPARLINVSVRAPVGTGGDILFGGFVIGGSTAETVLIRGIGPRLAMSPFGLTGVLAQPVLTLYEGSTPTGYSNTGWGSDPALSNAENTVGAYALPANSADCLLLVTLAPGTYSAEITGVNNTTGIAVVEVYEVF